MMKKRTFIKLDNLKEEIVQKLSLRKIKYNDSKK